MKRMLINATQEEELRMAMVDGQLLYDLNIEAPASERKKANIYKGKITRVEPSLEAAFVDYGAERHGFLPLKEISSEYFVKENKGGGKPNIKDVLKEGQDIVVQVEKEERGNKGAALTTFVSLAGRFIVLKPNKDRSGGVSRRITGEDRDLARQALNEIEIPENMSVILRTAGIDRSAEELAWDLQNLLTVWTAILNVVLERKSPFLLYRESDSVVRALRDYLTNDIGEILIDDEATYKVAYEHVEQTMPHNLRKLKHYVDPVPLFTRFQIETQIESAFAHTVTLPAGGSIVIDHTEACEFEISVASSLSTSSTWARRRISAMLKTDCVMRFARTERVFKSARSVALVFWRCRASVCVRRSVNRLTRRVRAVTDLARFAVPSHWHSPSCASLVRKRAKSAPQKSSHSCQ
jgi:ribonuclease E